MPCSHRVEAASIKSCSKTKGVAEMAAKKRDIYKYVFKRGNRILHGGITNDLERREGEHRRDIDRKGHIKQVGRCTTEDAARDWEENKGYA